MLLRQRHVLPVLGVERCRSWTAVNSLLHPLNNPHIKTLLHEPPAVRLPIALIGRNEIKLLHKRRHEFCHFQQRDVLADARS
jgi:hypothetical protein